MKSLLLVFLGGGMGSLVRYLIGKLIETEKGAFPWSTLIANFVGCLIIGFLLSLVMKNESLRSDIYLFAALGFCGGLTTFSTFSVENLFFLRTGDYLSFISYTFLSLFGGLLFVALGHSIFKVIS